MLGCFHARWTAWHCPHSFYWEPDRLSGLFEGASVEIENIWTFVAASLSPDDKDNAREERAERTPKLVVVWGNLDRSKRNSAWRRRCRWLWPSRVSLSTFPRPQSVITVLWHNNCREITAQREDMHRPCALRQLWKDVQSETKDESWFSTVQHVANHLLCFENIQGKISTEQIIKFPLSAAFAWLSLRSCFVDLNTDYKFTKTVQKIYLYEFTEDLPSGDERPRLKWMTDRLAPPLLPLASP